MVQTGQAADSCGSLQRFLEPFGPACYFFFIFLFDLANLTQLFLATNIPWRECQNTKVQSHLMHILLYTLLNHCHDKWIPMLLNLDRLLMKQTLSSDLIICPLIYLALTLNQLISWLWLPQHLKFRRRLEITRRRKL